MSGIWEHQEHEESIGKSKAHLVRASKEKRLGNFIIDMIAASIFMVLVLLIPSIVFEYVGIEAFAALDNINSWVDRLLSMLLRAVYYIIVETALNGRSIGKMVTGTRAVTLDGDVPDLETIVKRSFSRIVPFEPFSFLGSRDGWHDRWSNTMVIDTNLSDVGQDVTMDEYEY